MTTALLTFTGRMFKPLNPDPDDVDLEDIVQALSQTCRFGGLTSRFYSVAQHAVLVSYLAPKRHALWGLMHDAGEALSGFGDVATPVKQHLKVRIPGDREMYRSVNYVEELILKVIATALSLPWPPPDVSKYDEMALNIERNALMPDHPDWPKKPGFSLDRIPRDARMHHPGAANAVLYCWDPLLAASIFMDRYTELRGI